MRAERSCLPARVRPRGACSRRPCRCTPSSQAGAGSPLGPAGPTSPEGSLPGPRRNRARSDHRRQRPRLASQRSTQRAAVRRRRCGTTGCRTSHRDGLVPSVVCHRAPFARRRPGWFSGTCAPRGHFPWLAAFPPPPPPPQGLHPRPCSAASSVLRRDPTSRVRGSSLYARRLFDALCAKRLPAGHRRTRDLPVPEKGACARARGL